MKNLDSSHEFKERLKKARKIRGLGQSALAEKAGLPPSSISHFEGGGRKPSFENLRRLAIALEVTTDYLLGQVDEVGGAVAEADILYRHVKNLTEDDRELAQNFVKMLAERNQQGAPDDRK